MPVHPIKQTFQLNCIMNCYDQLNVFLLIDPIGQFGRISSQPPGDVALPRPPRAKLPYVPIHPPRVLQNMRTPVREGAFVHYSKSASFPWGRSIKRNLDSGGNWVFSILAKLAHKKYKRGTTGNAKQQPGETMKTQRRKVPAE